MSPIHPLLGLLTAGERHGYDLKRVIDREFTPYWRIDFGQLYRSLAKLTRAGWVKAHAESGVGGPERKVYALTAPGREAFEAWLGEPAQDRAEFFVKLRLAPLLGVTARHLIEVLQGPLKDEREARIQTYRTARAMADAGTLILAEAALRETETALAALETYQALVPPKPGRPAARPRLNPITITGSDDPLLTRLAELAHASTHAVGSLGGLLALAQHEADIAGVHLLDADTGEYNVPFVKHLLPEEPSLLVNLALRENGLLLAFGNPKKIRSVGDLTKRGVRFINRPRGTGTRLLLSTRLCAAGIDPHALRDWDRTATTHDAVAAAIAVGAADVGPGLRAVAVEWGLEFIPLGTERYDLVIPSGEFDSPRLRPLLDALHSPEFRRSAAAFQGYDLARSGQVVARISPRRKTT
jgi:molybdate-binding protein/DNA-binding PadR family transcriptional regulator